MSFVKKGLFTRALLLLATGLFLTILSCASSPDAYAPIDSNVKTGSYDKALVSLEDEKGQARKTIYTDKNEILFYLDRGMIRHFAGMYRESSQDLETAEQLIEDAFTKSITEGVGSYLANDNVKTYAGEDYEDLYVNVFNSLNYYHNGSLEGALVEVRRMNEKLLFLADRYQKAREKVRNSNKDITTEVESSQFSNSALARYLGMLFYRGGGNPDGVRIDYGELVQAYSLAPAVYTNQIPSSVEEELSVPAGKGRLNIIAFTGLSPVKIQESFHIPLPLPSPNDSARISLPKMIDRPPDIQRAEAVLDSGEKIRLELIEDMGAVAKETFKNKFGLTVLKSTARAIGKAVASAAASQAASSNDSGFGSLVGLAGRIYSEASEQADTRLSRYFPANALVGGINLDPGIYNVTINFYGSGGLVFSEVKEIPVRERALNLVQSACLK